MIKNKLNFIAGLICLFCFIAGIFLHKDAFVLLFSGVSAIVNILVGLFI